MTKPHRVGTAAVHCHIETAIAAIILAVAIWLYASNRGLEPEPSAGPSQREVEEALRSGR